MNRALELSTSMALTEGALQKGSLKQPCAVVGQRAGCVGWGKAQGECLSMEECLPVGKCLLWASGRPTGSRALC